MQRSLQCCENYLVSGQGGVRAPDYMGTREWAWQWADIYRSVFLQSAPLKLKCLPRSAHPSSVSTPLYSLHSFNYCHYYTSPRKCEAQAISLSMSMLRYGYMRLKCCVCDSPDTDTSSCYHCADMLPSPVPRILRIGHVQFA